jgi:hypothetical protein
MSCRVALLILALALLLPAGASAQQDPFGPLPQPQQTPAPPPEETEDPVGDDVGRETLYIIAGALLVAFVLVGMYISRDARRSVPKQSERSRLREEGPHRHERKAKAKARAKAKAQRAARRQNR